MDKLTATIITLNEEEKLRKCLESLIGWVDEIVVVDSGSTDKTLEIAKKFDAKIFVRNFDNFSNQRNFALDKASSKWILSIDADEVIPKNLSDEIYTAIQSKEFEGFLIPRKNFILKAQIKHSRWSPDKHIWLFQKNKGRWAGEVHEEVKVIGRVGELKNSKFHYQEDTVQGFIKKNNFYAGLLAKDMFKKGIRFSIIRFFYDPLFEFLIRFVYKKGFLDGWKGLILSLLMAHYQITVWLKLLSIRNQK